MISTIPMLAYASIAGPYIVLDIWCGRAFGIANIIRRSVSILIYWILVPRELDVNIWPVQLRIWDELCHVTSCFGQFVCVGAKHIEFPA